ncbi:MAG: PQQ-binding-like beta-propeller repeat protein [Ignavibacteriales bacterium]|nr:PQQ-binding-like beta-propeller repeat protein [Ignavibacteriales bacterium]
MRSIFHLTIVSIILASCLTGLMTDISFAASQNNNSNSQANPILWEFKTNGAIYTAPLVYNGMVFVGSLDSNFYALDAQTGNERWRFATGSPIRSNAAIWNSIICFESGNILYALNSQGKQIWKFTLYGDKLIDQYVSYDYFHSSPKIVNDIAFIGTDQGLVYGIDMKTGSQTFICQTTRKSGIRVSPAVSGNMVIFGDWYGVMYAYDITTGNKVWEFDTHSVYNCPYGNAINTPPIVHDNTVFFAGISSTIFSINAGTGVRNWSWKDPRTNENLFLVGGPVVSDSLIYIGGSSQHNAKAFNTLTGRFVWECKVDFRIFNSPTVDSSFIVLGTGDTFDGNAYGSLIAIDKCSGIVKARLRIANGINSIPVSADGKIFFGDNRGYVYALDRQLFYESGAPVIDVGADIIQLDTVSLKNEVIDTSFIVANTGTGSDSITVAMGNGIIPDSCITITPMKFYAAPQSSSTVHIHIRTSGLRAKTYNKYFSLNSKYFENIFGYPKQLRVTLAQPTGIRDFNDNIPRSGSLEQNYPNPFNPSTVIRYQLPSACYVSLKIFNIIGQELMTLVDGYKKAGNYSQLFSSTSEIPSGIYFYRIQAGEFQATKKMIIMK